MPKQDNIVIVGSGFSGLKLATLLSQSEISRNSTITLVSSDSRFIFLPLIPNMIDKSEKYNYTSLKHFCSIRNIVFIHKPVCKIEDKHILCWDQHTIPYDVVFVCTGSINSRRSDANSFDGWIEYLEKILVNSRNHQTVSLNIDKPNLASFELANALSSTAIDSYKLSTNYPSFITFKTHPLIRTLDSDCLKDLPILSKSEECTKKSAPSPPSPNLDCSDSNHRVILLGAALANKLNIKKSAQFASFSAKKAFVFAQRLYHSRFDRNQLKKYKDKYIQDCINYKARGFMLYTGKDNALVWLGPASPETSKYAIKGRVGSLTRLIFYRLENLAFYRDSMLAPFIYRLYAFLLKLQ